MGKVDNVQEKSTSIQRILVRKNRRLLDRAEAKKGGHLSKFPRKTMGWEKSSSAQEKSRQVRKVDVGSRISHHNKSSSTSI